MASMNAVFLVGRLGKDVELGKTKAGMSIATLSLATESQKGGEKITDWHKITVFDKVAENCAKYLSKGKMAGVEGRLSYSTYTDKNGEKRYSTEIVAHSVQFLTPNEEKGQGQQPAMKPFPQAQPQQSYLAPSGADLDDIPF